MTGLLFTAGGLYAVALMLALLASRGPKPVGGRRARATVNYAMAALVIAVVLMIVAGARKQLGECVVWGALTALAWKVSDRGLNEIDRAREEWWGE